MNATATVILETLGFNIKKNKNAIRPWKKKLKNKIRAQRTQKS